MSIQKFTRKLSRSSNEYEIPDELVESVKEEMEAESVVIIVHRKGKGAAAAMSIRGEEAAANVAHALLQSVHSIMHISPSAVAEAMAEFDPSKEHGH